MTRFAAVVRTLLYSVALVLASGAAQPAHAVVLPLASASMSILIGALPAIPLTWSGTGSADVTATGITGLSAGSFSFNGTLPVTDPTAFPITGVQVLGASSGSGTFVGVDLPTGGGPMAVMGVANLCLFAPCAAPPANLTVPFTAGGVSGIGLGGAPIVVSGSVTITVVGNPWSTGTVSFGSLSHSGSPLAANHVALVTPTLISTSLGISSPIIPVFTILDLTFVPEPGTLILLASGVAVLSIAGRNRMGA